MDKNVSVHKDVTKRVKAKIESYDIVLPSEYHRMYFEILSQFGLDNVSEVSNELETLQAEYAVLKKMLYEDDLTKTFNRKWIHDALMEEKTFTLRSSGTLVMIDVNKLKEINDTYGHIVGDNALVYFALKLKETKSRVIRYGGDEFILIFDHCFLEEDILQKLMDLMHSLGKTPFMKIANNDIFITFSFGMSAFHEGMKLEEVLKKADAAMYSHKKATTV